MPPSVLRAGLQDSAGPSAIEHALVGYACRKTAAVGSDEYQACYRTQIAVLRADFGPDLNRLTPADRLEMDTACSASLDATARDLYLACLNRQLDPIRIRLNENRKTLVAEVPLTGPLEGVAFELVQSRPGASSPGLLWIGVTFVTVAVAAGGAYAALRLRNRPPVRNCHVCGAEVPGSGDLCSDCRHAAAETRRSERAALEQAEREAKRRQAEEEERMRLLQRRYEEEARLRAEEEARAREERQRQREADLAAPPEPGASAAPVEDVFNPHAILEVTEDASAEAIHAAYEQARSKYDPALFAHLNAELQEHFKAKAQAVETAYQMLTDRQSDV